MKYDCMNIPIRNRDCVVVLNEDFAMYGPKGKNLEYGIVYGIKWILPLGGTSKKQLESADYVKLLGNELLPEIERKLCGVYEYFHEHQELPPPEMDIEEVMKEKIDRYFETKRAKHRPISPYDEDHTGNFVHWVNEGEEPEEDDMMPTDSCKKEFSVEDMISVLNVLSAMEKEEVEDDVF